MIRITASLAGAAVLFVVSVWPVSGQSTSRSPLADTVIVAAFSSPLSTHPQTVGWLPLSFGDGKGETSYEAGQQSGRPCLLAQARGSGSGLLKLVDLDPRSFPLLQWSWWVQGPLPTGDLTRKKGDDFPARIFVNFRFDSSKSGLLARIRHRLASRRFGGEAPGRSLVYVWGNRTPAGTMATSAYMDEAMQFVICSGKEEAGRWWTEERNILQDFEDAFGEEPPAVVSVAVMTDADDTGGVASACYGDILLFRR
jgi:hypothetical protein